MFAKLYSLAEPVCYPDHRLPFLIRHKPTSEPKAAPFPSLIELRRVHREHTDVLGETRALPPVAVCPVVKPLSLAQGHPKMSPLILAPLVVMGSRWSSLSLLCG